jgi:hypothetical protein
MSRGNSKKVDSALSPLDDWAPLHEAPFYCFSQGFIRSDEKWKEAVAQEIQKICDFIRQDPEFASASDSEWAVDQKGEPFSVELQAMGLSSFIAPYGVFVHGGSEASGFTVPISWGPSLDKEAGWADIPPSDQVAARLHRQVLHRLFLMWRYEFRSTLRNGRALIMARRSSVLAQFEQIGWDQWQFFKLDDPIAQQLGAPWYDPREHDVLLSATGPSGERLYGIYVAPGRVNAESEGHRPEDQCRQWLLQLLREYPDKRPRPLHFLCKDAVDKFPGLTQRAFQRALAMAQAESGNRTWSEAGAPRKIPAGIPAK